MRPVELLFVHLPMFVGDSVAQDFNNKLHNTMIGRGRFTTPIDRILQGKIMLPAAKYRVI